MNFDCVLFIGFGGPEAPEDIMPFLRTVTRGKNIPEERLLAVARHYEAIGGRSPYNESALKQAGMFKRLAESKGLRLPVYLGMRNWHPFLKDTIASMKEDGVHNAIGFILAPHRSYSSFKQYQENVEEAKQETGFSELAIQYVTPWHEHPLYIEAVRARVKDALHEVNDPSPAGTLLIFTAHSIPVAMAAESNYENEFKTSSSLLAGKFPGFSWKLAYQSRSGRPTDSWLEPDVSGVIGEARGLGFKQVLIVPIGFIADHAEMLYDLDITARQAAEKAGVAYHRAQTVGTHPEFIEMMVEVIKSCLSSRP